MKTSIKILVAVLAVIIGVFLAGSWASKQLERTEHILRTARNTNIGGGVTLIESIQAYCGTSGDWEVIIKKEGIVRVVAIRDLDQSSIDLTLKVNVENEEVNLLQFRYDGRLLDLDDADAVLNDMVRAATR